MDLRGEGLPLGSRGRKSNPWRILLYLLLIVFGVQLTRMVEAGRVKPVLSATPLPTRTSNSFSDQGKAFFAIGDMEAAIDAYQSAAEVEPENGFIWADMARIQVYSSELRTNSQLRQVRLAEARQSIEQALALAPDESYIHAVRALVYDWSATAEDTLAMRDEFLTEAEAAAVRANQLDPDNPLGLAFYAEVLTDQQKWAQALDLAEQAVDRSEDLGESLGDTRMDIYRVYGTVLESLGLYRRAIEEYERAALYTPNLAFLYLNIGVNYRQLLDYDTALDYFNKAVQINEQLADDLQSQDPVPYLAIGKTYLQQGEFFAAALNIAKALAINPADADVYGRLGIVYYKARNYESAIPVLKCATEGCTAEESQAVLCEMGYAECDPQSDAEPLVGRQVDGLPLATSSLEYYYTYGSALAYYSGTEAYPDGCEQAETIFLQLMRTYGEDPIVAGIVEENRSICARVEPGDSPQALPTAPLTVTPTP